MRARRVIPPMLLTAGAFFGLWAASEGLRRVAPMLTPAPVAHCPVAKVYIGMSWDELLRVCPNLERQWGYKVLSRYKLGSDEIREETEGNGETYLSWADNHEVVTVKDGRVDYATENVP